MAVIVNKTRHLISLPPPQMPETIGARPRIPGPMLAPLIPVAIDDRLLQNPGVQRLLRNGELEQLADDALTGELSPAAKIVNDNPDAFLTADRLRDPCPHPASLGSLLDQMERRWNATQKSLTLAHKAHKRPQDTEWKSYETQPFPRAEVATEMLRRYPWLDLKHLENPQHQFYQQQAEGLGRELKARNPSPPLERGDNGAASD
jgi:hypothetical protein